MKLLSKTVNFALALGICYLILIAIAAFSKELGISEEIFSGLAQEISWFLLAMPFLLLFWVWEKKRKARAVSSDLCKNFEHDPPNNSDLITQIGIWHDAKWFTDKPIIIYPAQINGLRLSSAETKTLQQIKFMIQSGQSGWDFKSKNMRKVEFKSASSATPEIVDFDFKHCCFHDVAFSNVHLKWTYFTVEEESPFFNVSVKKLSLVDTRIEGVDLRSIKGLKPKHFYKAHIDHVHLPDYLDLAKVEEYATYFNPARFA